VLIGHDCPLPDLPLAVCCALDLPMMAITFSIVHPRAFMRSRLLSCSGLVVACIVTHQAAAQTLPLVRPASPGVAQAAPCDPASLKCATLYLDGAVRTADKKSETTAATGSIGVNLGHLGWEAVAQINIAAATDTIRQAPGQSMLVPGSGGFTNGLVEGRGRFKQSGILGRAYYSLSSYTWELPATATEAAVASPMNILGSGLGLIWRMADGQIGGLDNAHLRLELNAGVMNRTLRGDASAEALAARRTAFLGTEKLSFSGIEWGLTIGYNDLRGSITYYSFPRASSIRGFTGGQAVAGFAIAAPLVQGALK
jgi:hypothetical protein